MPRSPGITRVAASLLLLFFFLSEPSLRAADDPANSSQTVTGKLVEVRQSVVRGYPLSRYAAIHVYTMYFTVKTATDTYCVEYDTPVLDEVKELRASSGKNVQLDLQGKKRVRMILPNNRQLKADLEPAEQC